MIDAFAWLGQLGEHFAKAIPTPLMVHANERAVYYRFGRNPREVGPRPYLVLPLVETIEIYSGQREITQTTDQTIERDGKEITTSGSCEWRIADVVKVSTECGNEVHGNVAHLVRDVINLYYPNGHYEKKLRARLRQIGVQLISFAVSDHAKTRALRIFGMN